jgi:hypothetical protein
MKDCFERKRKKKQIFKIRTKVKAGAYLGITLSAGSGDITTRP